MNPPNAPADSRTETAGAKTWLWALLSAGVCLAAISSQSLWIDEALTAAKASQAGFNGWWQAMLADKASDLQMPLYMIYVWGFARIFGTGEWALRAANVPWFVAGIVAFARAIPGRRRIPLVLVALVSPFAWYYLNEARPYAMQLGASLMIVAALYALSGGAVWCPRSLSAIASERRRISVSPATDSPARGAGHRAARWVAVFLFGIVALSGSSMLGMIWAGAACLCVPVLFSRERLAELLRAHRTALLISLAALLALAAYYVWTLKVGARASDVGKTGAGNAAFIAYELLGFSGLGPGRLEIRDGGLHAFAPFATQLAVYGVLVGDVVLLGAWCLYRSPYRRTHLLVALVATVPAILILSAGVVEHFRVLGRHFTPLLPVAILMAGIGLEARWKRRHWASKPMALAYVVLSLVGCLSFRFAARHQKDDYRDAAAMANGALREGKAVWWNAGREGAVYYQVPLADDAAKNGGAVWLMNPAAGSLARLAAPDLVITSKPDVFDGPGAMAEFLQHGRYVKLAVLPAFVVWQRPGAAGSPARAKLALVFDRRHASYFFAAP